MSFRQAIRRALSSAAVATSEAETGRIAVQRADPLFRKMLYRCNHRGMVENELILTSYIQRHFSSMSEQTLGLFERLLDEPDPSIYRWFTGAAQADPEYDGSELLESIRSHLKTMN